jgi:hypothetical protein
MSRASVGDDAMLPQNEVGNVGRSVFDSGCRLVWYSLSPWAWSVLNLWVKLLVGEVRVEPPSHASDGAADSVLAVMWCCCQVMTAITTIIRLYTDGP